MQNSLLSSHLLTSFKKSTALVQGKKSQTVESKGRLCAAGGPATTKTTTKIYSTIHPCNSATRPHLIKQYRPLPWNNSFMMQKVI
ncbi:hypothetical protein AOLI_G00121660 [Acnodon oligacanthus]